MVGTSALLFRIVRNWPTELLRAAASTPLPTEDTKVSAAAAANAGAEPRATGSTARAKKLRRENGTWSKSRIISSSSKRFDGRHGGRREARDPGDGFAGDIAIRDLGLPHLSINIADACIKIRRCFSQTRIIVENRFTPGHQLNCRRR